MSKQSEDVWQSIRLLKKPFQQLDQTRDTDQSIDQLEEKENVNSFMRNKGQCQCQSKMMQMKKECLVQIRELKADHQIELENLRKEMESQMQAMKEKYENEIRSLREDLETQQSFANEEELIEQFERQQTEEREVFKAQLQKYIEDKIHLEHQLSAIKPMHQSVHKNVAQSLYRDTNRKSMNILNIDKLTLESDRSILHEDSAFKNGNCNSIKNFNVHVKLMDNSLKHII